MNLTTLTLIGAAVALSTNTAMAQQNHRHHNNHTYAPSEIMGTHSHSKGEWMLSYKYMSMKMDGMLQGTNNIDKSTVYGAGYMVSPLEMETKMHMLSAMYGISGNFTFMAMLPYTKKSMDLRTMSGTTFTTKTEGFGDIKLSVIDNLSRFNLKNWSISYGLSLPTGAIDKTGNTPAANNARLGYPMQLGSGTFDLKPAIIYKNSHENIEYGLQAFANIRTGDNTENYRLGNQFGLNLWAGKKITPSFSAGLSLKTIHESEIHGKDVNLNANMVTTNDTNNSGYEKAILGVDLFYKPAQFKGLEFITSYKEPIYQDVNGFQMDADKVFTLTIRKTF